MRPENDPFPLLTAQMLIEKEMEYDRWYKEIPSSISQRRGGEDYPPILGGPSSGSVSGTRAGRRYQYTSTATTRSVLRSPYWEIFPAADNDIARYAMNDIDGLSKAQSGDAEAVVMLLIFANLGGPGTARALDSAA